MKLQTIFTDGSEHHKELGDHFHVVRKDQSPEKFADYAKEIFGGNQENLPDTHSIIVWNCGNRVEPIYKDFSYFIRNDNGEVYQDLTFR